MTPAKTRSVPPDRVIANVSDRRPALLDVIREAKREITLSLFRCNDAEIFAELTRAVARGVTVNAVVTSRAKGGKKKLKKLWDALQRTGASVHPYTDPVVKYHAKYLVADEGPAVVASQNLTRKCFERTCDALVLTHDPAVVTGLRHLMAADRDGAAMPQDLSPRLIVQATSSIRLIDAKLSDPDLVERLNKRRAEGLTVEVYGSKRLGALKSHGKIMLIDGRLAVVGSLALAALSLDFRREVAIIVEDPAAVADVEEVFRSIDAVPTAGRIAASGAVGGAVC